MVENNADEKVEELRTEIRSELTRIVDRVGQTDAQLSSVKEQLEGVVDKAIVRSRQVDHEAREETLKAVVSSYVEKVPFGIKKTMDEAVGDPGVMKYKLTDILKAFVELSNKGTIKFDSEINHWTQITPTTTFSVEDIGSMS
ncbi:MAG: hypothetical protein M3539_09655 [Acidobacteriota bacterium]|nr:hypothetical protein [Acidobacteriota bacterium]